MMRTMVMMMIRRRTRMSFGDVHTRRRFLAGPSHPGCCNPRRGGRQPRRGTWRRRCPCLWRRPCGGSHGTSRWCRRPWSDFPPSAWWPPMGSHARTLWCSPASLTREDYSSALLLPKRCRVAVGPTPLLDWGAAVPTCMPQKKNIDEKYSMSYHRFINPTEIHLEFISNASRILLRAANLCEGYRTFLQQLPIYRYCITRQNEIILRFISNVDSHLN